jgi:hypothetical protein
MAGVVLPACRAGRDFQASAWSELLSPFLWPSFVRTVYIR